MNLIEKEGLFDKEISDDKEEIEEMEAKKEEEIETITIKPKKDSKPIKIAETEDSDDDEFMHINQEVEEESLFTLKKPK